MARVLNISTCYGLNRLVAFAPDVRAFVLTMVLAMAPGLSLAQNSSPSSTGTTPADAPIRVLLVPQREITVVAQTVGQVRQIGGELGASVAESSILVAFDCGENQARLRMSEAELESARQNYDAKTRMQKLNAAGEVEVAMALSAVEKARAQIELSKVQLRQCVVPAPFAGRIVKLHVKPFQVVNVGQPLLEVVSSGPLKVKLNAPSRWLAWLKPGVRFEVQIDETGRSYPAVVTAINGRVDAVSQSIELEGRINGTFNDLLAGMSGNARFGSRQ